MELRTEIEIQATPEQVWRVLLDFPAYPEWNPFITAISGAATAGGVLDVALSPPNGKHYYFKPTVVTCEASKELRWRGRYLHRRVFQGEHFFQLEAKGEQATRFVHGENFSGWALKFLTPLLTQTARGFVYMNQALKRRVEETRAKAR